MNMTVKQKKFLFIAALLLYISTTIMGKTITFVNITGGILIALWGCALFMFGLVLGCEIKK